MGPRRSSLFGTLGLATAVLASGISLPPMEVVLPRKKNRRAPYLVRKERRHIKNARRLTRMARRTH